MKMIEPPATERWLKKKLFSLIYQSVNSQIPLQEILNVLEQARYFVTELKLKDGT